MAKEGIKTKKDCPLYFMDTSLEFDSEECEINLMCTHEEGIDFNNCSVYKVHQDNLNEKMVIEGNLNIKSTS